MTTIEKQHRNPYRNASPKCSVCGRSIQYAGVTFLKDCCSRKCSEIKKPNYALTLNKVGSIKDFTGLTQEKTTIGEVIKNKAKKPIKRAPTRIPSDSIKPLVVPETSTQSNFNYKIRLEHQDFRERDIIHIESPNEQGRKEIRTKCDYVILKADLALNKLKGER